MLKRMLTVVLAVVCTMALMPAFAEGGASVPNPMRDMTAEEMLAETGISFDVPEAAQEVAYSMIDMGTEPSISQVQYTLDGVTYCVRAQSGEALSDTSGMFYEWTAENAVELPYAQEAEVRYIAREAGIILWFNAAMGLNFSVSMDTGATEDALVAVAEPIAAAQTQEADGDGDRMAMAYDVADETWLNVRLEANATTGYAWKYEVSDENMLACDGTDYLPDETVEGVAGAGGTYVAAFSPTMNGAGALTLTFRYARDWESEEAPAETYVFDLWITEAGTLSVEGVK